MAQSRGSTEWSELLEATRLALSALRLEDLEKLAVRAEEMLDAARKHDARSPAQKVIPHHQRRLLEERRLLGGVLAATQENLDVLRRLRGAPEWHGAGGLDSRWVR